MQEVKEVLPRTGNFGVAKTCLLGMCLSLLELPRDDGKFTVPVFSDTDVPPA